MAKGGIPPQAPISYLVTYELFETLMYCVPPPSQPLKPKLIYGLGGGGPEKPRRNKATCVAAACFCLWMRRRRRRELSNPRRCNYRPPPLPPPGRENGREGKKSRIGGDRKRGFFCRLSPPLPLAPHLVHAFGGGGRRGGGG